MDTISNFASISGLRFNVKKSLLVYHEQNKKESRYKTQDDIELSNSIFDMLGIYIGRECVEQKQRNSSQKKLKRQKLILKTMESYKFLDHAGF